MAQYHPSRPILAADYWSELAESASFYLYCERELFLEQSGLTFDAAVGHLCVDVVHAPLENYNSEQEASRKEDHTD